MVRRRLRQESERIGRPAHVVAAFDTELFGHWWHEDRAGWNDCCARCPRPVSGSAPSPTPSRPDSSAPAVELPPSSWGSGKDGEVWNGEKVSDLVQLNAEVVDTALAAVDKALAHRGPGASRDLVADQILREDAADGVQ